MVTMTVEERVSRIETVLSRTPAWIDYQYREWQKKRAEELRLQGLSGRAAKNKAWHEAQNIDFSGVASN